MRPSTWPWSSRGSPNWGSVSRPSTSSLVSPASASAFRTASACRDQADRPASLPKVVTPTPATAVLPVIVMAARVYADLTRESVHSSCVGLGSRGGADGGFGGGGEEGGAWPVRT